jgi:hypothetical protein
MFICLYLYKVHNNLTELFNTHFKIRVNDDSIVDLQSNQLWERIVIWQLDNGWPFQVQWNTFDPYDEETKNGAHNVTVRNIQVIHVESGDWNYHPFPNAGYFGLGYKSVFGAKQGLSNIKTGFTFHDIDVDGGLWIPLVSMQVGISPFSDPKWTKGEQPTCCNNGVLSDFTFRNINVQYTQTTRSSLKVTDPSAGGLIQNILFDNVNVDGSQKYFKENIDYNFEGVEGIRFEN